MKKYILALCLAASVASASPSLQLANELMKEGQYRRAAIEFRRSALEADKQNDSAALSWAAAYAYYQQQDIKLAMKMLDFCDETQNSIECEITLLRLDASIASKSYDSAMFYAESLEQASNASIQHIAALRKTKLCIINGNLLQAERSLPAATPPQVKSALRDYAAGHDKSPTVGGLLGMIPGMGYAYSGEYANALRSIIMNGIFIYAMVETGDNDNWGVFSVLTFFEITWYTGSIYGGIDSAQRYNQHRLQACLQVIDNHSCYKPNLHKLPAISLRYTF